MTKRLALCLFFCTQILLISCNSGQDKKPMKVFRYNQGEGITNLDPAFASTQANVRASGFIFNGLVTLDKNLNIIPDIAQSWEVSEDGLTYTFHLRNDIYFTDNECFSDLTGRRVVANDFVYSYFRILNPTTSSTGSWVFNDKVSQLDGKPAPDCFSAPDENTFVINLSKPFPAFLSILTMPYGFVVPKEAVDKYGKDFSRHPVGTGAFKMKQWDEGNTLVLLKNEKYYKKDAQGQSLPYLDAVVVSFLQDKNTAFLTFRQGQNEFFSGIDENSPSMLLNEQGDILEEYQGKFRFEKKPYLNTEYIGFNVDPDLEVNEHAPWMHKEVRQAMNYAIDRKGLVAFLRNNLGKPGTSGFVPAALPSFDEGKVKGYNYAPDKVQELLAQAGYPEGKGLTEMTLYTVQEYKMICEYLVKQWSDAGIKVKLEINASAGHHDLVNNGKAGLFRASWLGDYPDAESYLALFYSKNFTPGGPNKSHFVNQIYDRFYEEALLEVDAEKRYELYNKMDQIIMEEAPVVVLYYDEVIRLTQNNVHDMEANAMNLMNLDRVRIE